MSFEKNSRVSLSPLPLVLPWHAAAGHPAHVSRRGVHLCRVKKQANKDNRGVTGNWGASFFTAAPPREKFHPLPRHETEEHNGRLFPWQATPSEVACRGNLPTGAPLASWRPLHFGVQSVFAGLCVFVSHRDELPNEEGRQKLIRDT